MTSPKKIDSIENNHESRITRLEVTIENINQTLIRFDKRFDDLEDKFESHFNKLDNRMWQMMLFMFSGFGSTLFILAKIKGWV